MGNFNKLLVAFLGGALAGGILTYMVNDRKEEEWKDEFVDIVEKTKTGIAHQISKLQAYKESLEKDDDVLGV